MMMTKTLIACGICQKEAPLPEMSLAKNGEDMICGVCRHAMVGPVDPAPAVKKKKKGEPEKAPAPIFFFRR